MTSVSFSRLRQLQLDFAVLKGRRSFRDNKSGIYLFNRSTEINFGNGSLSPAIRLKNFASTTGEVISSDVDRFLKISANLQMSYLRNEVGDSHFFLHFRGK